MAEYFTQKQIDIYRECFTFIVSQGYIQNPSQLSNVMHCMGFAPTLDEVKQSYKGYNKNGAIDFPTMLQLIYKYSKVDTNPEREILLAFQASDPGKSGKISVQKLRQILCGFGETLSRREFDDLLRECNLPNSGSVPYTPIVKTICQSYSRLQVM